MVALPGSNCRFGGAFFSVIAGPCSVESAARLARVSSDVSRAGAVALRGGAFKPRTWRTSFQGHGVAALELLAAARSETGLPVVTEVLDPRDVETVGETADMVQIGMRNMQNFALLREVGRLGKPVLLKRNAAATVDELLGAADYVRGEGNDDVVLCERGIRGFEPATRYTLDLSVIPVLRERTDLPLVVDPSHATGRRGYVVPMARAALAAGADGLIVEVHDEPAQALSDGAQALLPDDFSTMMRSLRALAEPLDRQVCSPVSSDSAISAGPRVD